jgi:glycosyltransferase involved in cell wall biosynthesis
MSGDDNTWIEGNEPLVTVVITTYNHAAYLPDSIESVLGQTYPQIELIIVDDGSIDNTKEVVSGYPSAKYLFQENKGLPSARNTGASNSSGNYIVFLDADDMLYPDAIKANVQYFQIHPKCGFISGGYDLMAEDKKMIDAEEWQQIPQHDHYKALLRCDYISMHAAVMYRRDIFGYYHFDETLTSCEDYDFYLQIARNYAVFSHNIKLAAYRKHSESMSGNIIIMYHSAMQVMNKHKDENGDPEIKKSWLAGKRDIRHHYNALLFHRLTSGRKHQKIDFRNGIAFISLLSFKDILRLIAFYLKASVGWFIKKLIAGSQRLKRILPGGSSRFIPKEGQIRIGDLDRTAPFSKSFGYDRGGPVDRYYIERFLENNAGYIKGNVLEIGDNAYTLTYGGQRVSKSDVLYIDESNPAATIIGDLSKADQIPSDKFDCIILTQTLHLIYDFKAALEHCARILKKGGVLLMTVPGITQIDYGEWGDTWYWSFTGNVINKLLGHYFKPADVQVQTFGNVVVAASFLYGLGKNELNIHELEQNDPSYQVIITAKAVKR